MTTSSFVDYIPKSERTTGLIKGTFKINENHELGVEYLTTQSKVRTDRAGAIRRPVHELPAS
jgi:iron complex outermembrane receptor protein